MAYLYLAIAIISEVIGTSALKASNEFTRLIPSIIVIIGYSAAFYFRSRNEITLTQNLLRKYRIIPLTMK